MFGHRWDTACADLRRFLAGNQITFEWATPDSPDVWMKWSTERPADVDRSGHAVLGRVQRQVDDAPPPASDR